MGRGYPDDVEAIVSFELDARSAAEYADNTERRLDSVKLLGLSIAVHLQRIGVSTPPR